MVKKTSRKTAAKADAFNFETSLQELESLVERMEQGEQTLEESLKDFERGIKLTRECQAALEQAEQKVKILLEKTGTAELQDFDSED